MFVYLHMAVGCTPVLLRNNRDFSESYGVYGLAGEGKKGVIRQCSTVCWDGYLFVLLCQGKEGVICAGCVLSWLFKGCHIQKKKGPSASSCG
jgi:hypothetical protein